MGSFSIERVAPGRLAASGELGFTTAAGALTAGQRLIGDQPCTIDLASITEGDSAGLAVLLEWLATAASRGTELRYVNVPSQILAIARISEVQDLLTQP